MVHEGTYVSGAREWCSRVREYVSGAREYVSGALEGCTRERLRELVSKQPVVSSLACVRKVEANFS